MGAHGETTTASALLDEVARMLADAGIEDSRAEARALMAEILRISRSWLLAHPEALISAEATRTYLDAAGRRARREPFAYVAGHREFYGLDLEVTPDTLIPRPETEMLVEQAAAAAIDLSSRKTRPLRVVDLGTGSGAVAIAIAKLVPGLRIIAVDTSGDALRVAARNARTHRVADRIDFREQDLLAGMEGPLDIIVANLPYIPSADIDGLMPEVSEYEPRFALDGGPGGTTLIRRAMVQSVPLMDPPAALLFEIGEGQGESLASLAADLFPGAAVRVLRDYSGLERILVVEMGSKEVIVHGSPRAEVIEWPADAVAQRDLIERAAALLRAGEIVAFPTDTVYGIAADPSNEAAVRRLYTVKGRSPEKAIALLVSGEAQLEWITDPALPGLAPLAEAFWPGGLTVVVPARPDAAVATGQPFSTVGLRMPDHPVPLALIREMGYPLATTSANLSGAPSPKTAAEVENQIGDRIALIIDGGECPGGTDSTVVDLTTNPPTVRRVGAVPVGRLVSILGPVEAD